MARVVGLILGFALLAPAAVVIYIRYLGGSAYDLPDWLYAIGHIAISVPMLVFITVAGIAAIGFSIRAMMQRDEP